MVFLELIFLFSPFSATKTKLLPPVMDDSESSCFLSKKKYFLLEYLFFLFPLIQTKSLILKHFTFFHNQNILLQKACMAIAFPLYNFIGELAVIHVTFKNFWCMVLRYHILHYLWYKQPPIFKL